MATTRKYGSTRRVVKVAADQVEEDDFLPGLDNGYVVDVEEGPDLRGDYNTRFAGEHVLITFHDADGNENYLLLLPEHEIEVART